MKDCNIILIALQDHNIALIFFEDHEAFPRIWSAFGWIDPKYFRVNPDKEDVPVLFLKKSNNPLYYILNLLNIIKFSIKNIKRNTVAFTTEIERKHLPYALFILFLSRGRIYVHGKEGKLNLVLLRNLFVIALPWRLKKCFSNLRSYILTILFRLIVGSWVKKAEKQHEK